MRVFNYMPLKGAYRVEQYLNGRVRGYYIGSLDPLESLPYRSVEVVTPIDKKLHAIYNKGRYSYVNYAQMLKHSY